MKVLVAGGAGCIGSHTAQALIGAGHQVVILDNITTGFREAIPDGVGFVQGDVRNRDFLAEVLSKYSVEAVVHFAAKLIVPESIEKPMDCVPFHLV